MISPANAFLPPKDLAAALNAAGIRGPGGHAWAPRACRALVRAMRAYGFPAIRSHRVRTSDAVAFMRARPSWRPFSKRNP